MSGFEPRTSHAGQIGKARFPPGSDLLNEAREGPVRGHEDPLRAAKTERPLLVSKAAALLPVDWPCRALGQVLML